MGIPLTFFSTSNEIWAVVRENFHFKQQRNAAGAGDVYYPSWSTGAVSTVC